jgi:uncharacterized protein (DUF1778 family)
MEAQQDFVTRAVTLRAKLHYAEQRVQRMRNELAEFLECFTTPEQGDEYLRRTMAQDSHWEFLGKMSRANPQNAPQTKLDGQAAQ